MANILKNWKRRHLTIFGKNLLINSLSNSLFVYNAEIEYPPKDFIQKVEKIHKDFLWEGTAKIAHHTIIGEYFNGGIKYKDLNDFIAALNALIQPKLSQNSLEVE